MNVRNQTMMIVATFALAACMGGGRQPEAVEPETTATAGGTVSGDPQASAEADMDMRGEMYPEPDEWGQQDQFAEQDEWGQEEQPGQPPVATDDDDQDLQGRVEAALRTAPNLDDDSIQVRVDGSRVHLAGIVDSPTEIAIARDTAHAVPGVVSVDIDELRVVG